MRIIKAIIAVITKLPEITINSIKEAGIRNKMMGVVEKCSVGDLAMTECINCGEMIPPLKICPWCMQETCDPFANLMEDGYD